MSKPKTTTANPFKNPPMKSKQLDFLSTASIVLGIVRVLAVYFLASRGVFGVFGDTDKPANPLF
jgi:hypothetical protein